MNVNQREWDYTMLYQVGDPAKGASRFTLKWALHHLNNLLVSIPDLYKDWKIIHITDGKVDGKYSQTEAERILKLSEI
jgi:hypothetical protein